MTSVDKAFVFISIAIVAIAVSFTFVQSNIEQSAKLTQIGGADQQSGFLVGGVAQQEAPDILEQTYVSIDPPQIKPIRSSAQLTTVLVEGKIVDYNKGHRIFLYLERPDGELNEYSVLGTKSGEFSLTLAITPDYKVEGEYNLTVNYPNKNTVTTSTNLIVTENPIQQISQPSSTIPNQCELKKSGCEICIESTTEEQFTCTRNYRAESCGGTRVCNIVASVPLPSEIMKSSSTSESPLTSQSTAEPPPRDIKEFSISTKRVIVTEGQTTEFTVSGHVPNTSSPTPVELELFLPDASSVKFDTMADTSGDFELKLNFEITDEQGKYLVKGKTSRIGLGEQTFHLEHHIVEIKEKQVPSWIKTNVQWWSEGTIPDSEFLRGIEFMIKENIIEISDLPPSSSDDSSPKQVPEWIRTNAAWWVDDRLSDPEFINALEFLVKEGIITP